MKPTQLTELFANIKNTFVSFFSILMFVALGVGIFVGISWSGPALENAAQRTFDEGAFHNFQIQFPYGLTEDDLAKLSTVDGVSDVEGAYQSFQNIQGDTNRNTIKVLSLGERVDIPLVKEGKLPTQPNELALKATSAQKLGLAVGDTITFKHDANTTTQDMGPTDSGMPESDSGDMQYLQGDTYLITGLMENADYLADSTATYGYSTSPSGSVEAIAWVLPSAFKPQAFQNAYPLVNIRSSCLDGKNTYSKAYKEQSQSIEDCLVQMGDELGTARYDDLHGQAQAKIDDAERQLADAHAKIEEGQSQVDEGRAELNQKQAQGEAQLASAYNELMYYEQLKAAGEEKLAEARERLGVAQHLLDEFDATKAYAETRVDQAVAFKVEEDRKLQEGIITPQDYQKDLDAYGANLSEELRPFVESAGMTLPTIDHTNMEVYLKVAQEALAKADDIPIVYEGEEMTVGQARQKLFEATEEFLKAQSQYDDLVANLAQGWSQYYVGTEQLHTAVNDGEQKLADGQAAIDSAQRQIDENEPKLADAKKQLEKMKKYSWSVAPRAFNAGAAEVEVFSNVTYNLSFSMAALFIIVGLLVSYSAVSRIVHEQIIQIGTKKALGLRSKEITMSFVAYSGFAVILGALIGLVVGVYAVQGIIGHVLSGMFIFGDYPAYFGLPLFLVVTLLQLLLVLGATWLACRKVLKQHAVDLLKGEKPPSGKTRFYEKWALWDKLPLFVQTIANNCVNDKRRVFSTIVGVAGCTALIVTAITLNNDVLKSYDRHYANVYGFNAITYIDTSVDEADNYVDAGLRQAGFETAKVHRQNMIIHQPDGGRGTATMIAPDDNETFQQIYHVNSIGKESFDPSQDGVWITQAYAHHLGAKVGDMLVVDAGDGAKHELPILGFHEFWLTYFDVILNKDYFQREFDTAALNNVVLADTNGYEVSHIKEEGLRHPGFFSVVDDKTFQHGNFETFSSVSSAVVLIYLALSILMAVVVLLNLNVMFIGEKKRELIVLMINGFSVKDAKRYIYYDGIVLSALGIILGVVVGCIMGSVTVSAIEPATATFVKEVDWMAVLIGVVGSAILAILMSVIALRRIPRFQLTDINKL